MNRDIKLQKMTYNKSSRPQKQAKSTERKVSQSVSLQEFKPMQGKIGIPILARPALRGKDRKSPFRAVANGIINLWQSFIFMLNELILTASWALLLSLAIWYVRCILGWPKTVAFHLRLGSFLQFWTQMWFQSYYCQITGFYYPQAITFLPSFVSLHG